MLIRMSRANEKLVLQMKASQLDTYVLRDHRGKILQGPRTSTLPLDVCTRELCARITYNKLVGRPQGRETLKFRANAKHFDTINS
jgi:hypothetical protein